MARTVFDCRAVGPFVGVGHFLQHTQDSRRVVRAANSWRVDRATLTPSQRPVVSDGEVSAATTILAPPDAQRVSERIVNELPLLFKVSRGEGGGEHHFSRVDLVKFRFGYKDNWKEMCSHNRKSGDEAFRQPTVATARSSGFPVACQCRGAAGAARSGRISERTLPDARSSTVVNATA